MCYVPLHGTAELPCNYENGIWLHNSSTLDMMSTSNLTLTNVHYNDSGRYLYNVKEQNKTDLCYYKIFVGGMIQLLVTCVMCVMHTYILS